MGVRKKTYKSTLCMYAYTYWLTTILNYFIVNGGQKSEIGFSWLKSGCWQGWFLLKDPGEHLFLCHSFPVSGGLPHSLAPGPFLPSLQPLFSHHISYFLCSQISLCLPLMRTLVNNTFGAQPIIQISRSHLKILNLPS